MNLYSMQVDIYCIFDANTTHKLHPDEREIYLHLLEHKNFFHQVSGGKRADDYILELADIYESPVISNDNYSDPKYSRYAWKDREAEPMRLFMGEVINTPFGDHLLLPDLDLRAVLDKKVNHLYRELESLFNPPKERYKGFVKFYMTDKGWGQIDYFKQETIYFKKSPSMKKLQGGQEVEFTLNEGEKGTFATEIVATHSTFKGEIIHYDEQRACGYVKMDTTDKKIFFYKTYFKNPEIDDRILRKKVKVEFEIGKNPKGECAKNISVVINKNKERFNALEKQKDDLAFLLKEAGKKLENTTRKIAEQHTELLRLKKALARITGVDNITKEEEILAAMQLPAVKELLENASSEDYVGPNQANNDNRRNDNRRNDNRRNGKRRGTSKFQEDAFHH